MLRSKMNYRVVGLISAGVFSMATFSGIDQAKADEGGVSFWLPGLFGSLAAVPQQPGWSLATVYYHTSVSAFGNTAAAREATIGRFSPTVNVDLNVKVRANAGNAKGLRQNVASSEYPL